MQGGNRFLDFANEIMARHRGLGFGFEPAAMLYLEDTEKYPEEQAVARQNLTTNLYHIQNVREENYLFKQNLEHFIAFDRTLIHLFSGINCIYHQCDTQPELDDPLHNYFILKIAIP
jgi:hypothetical protein